MDVAPNRCRFDDCCDLPFPAWRVYCPTHKCRATARVQRRHVFVREYYNKHRAEIVAYQKQYHASRRWIARMECIERLGGCCATCGEARDLRLLQFDHVQPEEKRDKISTMIGNGWFGGESGHLKPSILRELAKCQLLCANCHAIKSFTDWEKRSA